MEPEILQTITISSFAPVAFLLVWKFIIPWSNVFLAKLSGTDTSADARLHKIENDFTHEVRADIAEMKINIENLRQEFGNLRLKVAVLEERIK